MRKNSVKNSRINGEVQRVLAEVIRGEIKDPRIAPMTSVVDVEVAPVHISAFWAARKRLPRRWRD